MTGRERIVKSINHRSAPLAVDFGSTAVTGMHVSVVAELRRYFGFADRPVRVIEPYQMLGEIDPELAGALHVDTVGIFPQGTLFGFGNENWKKWRAPWGQDVLVPGKFEVDEMPDGSLEIYPKGDRSAPRSGRMPTGSVYFDSIIRQQAFAEDELKVEDNLTEFKPLDDEDLDYFRREAEAIADSPCARVMTVPGTGLGDIAHVPAPYEPYPKGIRDVEEWYVSTVIRRDFVNEIFRRQTDIAIANLERLHEVVGEIPDIAFVCGTDFGTQTSQFCSPETFDGLWAPHYSRINRWIHEHTTWKTMKHSCGSVVPLIDRFIACGFDILNPVQITAVGMDKEALKNRFGDRLAFWGGGIDTQKTLPFGTPDQVRDETRANIDAFGNDGGFVFNAIHNVQAKTPVANIVAMIEALSEYR